MFQGCLRSSSVSTCVNASNGLLSGACRGWTDALQVSGVYALSRTEQQLLPRAVEAAEGQQC